MSQGPVNVLVPKFGATPIYLLIVDFSKCLAIV